jgi:RNA polymerase sigma-70 factor, ECF subfamily
MRPMRDDRFQRLYAEHAEALFGFLSYRTGDRVLAADLLAEAFERVLHARRRFNPLKASEKTWLYAIALDCAREHARRRSGEGRAIERIASARSPGSTAEMETIADRDLVSAHLAALSEEEREAIALRFGADLTVPEIAKLTGERLATVRGRVYRALRKLRDAMD